MILWCELAWLGGDRVVEGVELIIEHGRIASIGQGIESPAPSAIRLDGLTIPGMANAHSHAFHRALRARTERGSGSFWSWRDDMYRLAETLDPDLCFSLARAVYAEMLDAGITAVGEFHYVHHDRSGKPFRRTNAMGQALIAAASDAGIRLTLLDTLYLHGGIGEPLDGVQRRFGDGTVENWLARVDEYEESSRARIGAAVHSVRAVEPADIATVARWAAQRGAPLHAHVSEQPAENEASIAAYGTTPTGVFRTAGALGPSFTAVHATHLTDEDIDALAGSSSTVCACPTTERELADGVGPFAQLVENGASLALGSDSQATIDLFEEARAVELNQRLVTGRRGLHTPVQLLEAATVGGHRSIGWADSGRIEAGALADLVTLDLGSVRLAGTRAPFAVDAVVFAATAADVTRVIVGGETVVADGSYRRFDLGKALADVLGTT